MKDKYYAKIDILRLIAVVAVLLFHLNILKGGFLAVCVFFVLSGYLSALSSFRKKKFSFKDYYINKFKRLYLPLLIVVFITVAIIFLWPDINWINLKPETTSVLGGYNNFWQLKVNMDYFTRNVNSPFTHFWFIAILLQFDLIYPLIYLIIKRKTDRVNRIIPFIVLTGLSIISGIYFYISYKNNSLMFAYYNTFARLFSLIWGLWLGYMSVYFDHIIPKFLRNKIISNIIFYAYLIGMIVMFVLIGSNSKYFAVMLLVVSFMTVRLLDYGTLDGGKPNKLLKYLSTISYEVYLVQYPIIYVLSFIVLNKYLKIGIAIISTIIISIIINFALSKKEGFKKIIVYVLRVLLIGGCVFGIYKYIVTEDYSKEMQELQEQLSQNEQLVLKKQEEYIRNMERDKVNKDNLEKKYENNEKALDDKIANIEIVGIGDSVMLGAVGNLYKQFPNGYFDANISRTGWVANSILVNLKKKDLLGEVIVIGLGTNGDCPESIKDTMMETIGDRLTFWITVTNDRSVGVNDTIKEYAKKYPNLYIIDWEAESKGHNDYFLKDGIHLTEKGREAYTKLIFKSIYNYYYEELQKDKKQVLGKMEEALKDNYTFYGNDLLLNSIEYLEKDFSGAKYVTSKENGIEETKKDITSDKKKDVLNNNIVLVFDEQEKISIDEYKDIINLCEGRNVYIVSLNNDLKELKNIATIINLKQDLSNGDYYMVDGIHLNRSGNEILVKRITEGINSK